jgi:hypothetical protein
MLSHIRCPPQRPCPCRTKNANFALPRNTQNTIRENQLYHNIVEFGPWAPRCLACFCAAFFLHTSYRASHETGDKRECCLLCRLFCSHRGFLCFKHNERKNTYLARFALHSRRQPLSLQLEGLDHFHPILFLLEQRKCDAKSTMHAREYEI